MTDLNLNRAEFVRSAAAKTQFIHSGLPKVAFAGKSNVGKSSVINRLLNRKQFARVGATPGKTVHVNYFLIDGRLYLIDLPGYGFARVPQSEKERQQVSEAILAAIELGEKMERPTDVVESCDVFLKLFPMSPKVPEVRTARNIANVEATNEAAAGGDAAAAQQ